jgi:hypothetical protein
LRHSLTLLLTEELMKWNEKVSVQCLLMDIKPQTIVWVLLLGYFVAADHFTQRKVIIEDKSVECGPNNTLPLFHVRALKHGHTHDVIHYLITTWTVPTILLKHVMRPTTLVINKTHLCNRTGHAFTFKDAGGESTADLSGLSISQVFPYIDRYDDITLHTDGHRDADVLPHFEWTPTIMRNEDEVLFEGIDHNITNATLRFTVTFHTEHGQGVKPPKNPINANLTEFRLEMINLRTDYKQIRYAAEVMFFNTAPRYPAGSVTPEAKHTTMQYIDDEYTPGVFEIWAVKFLPHLSRVRRTYATWKPISYHSDQCLHSDQGLVKKFMKKDGKGGAYTKLDNPLPPYKGRTPYGLLSGIDASYYRIFVTYGIPKDGFYNKYPYLSWSGMVGSGTPPEDKMSTKLILTIAIGLGTPGVVIILGIIFLLFKKIQSSNEITYDEIH